MWIGDLIDLG